MAGARHWNPQPNWSANRQPIFRRSNRLGASHGGCAERAVALQVRQALRIPMTQQAPKALQPWAVRRCRAVRA
jgi:hypothetical protein